MPHEPTPRILFVVDDDELVRALSARFENLGYRCAVATAADACRGPRADGVDLVIAAPEGPAATVVDLVHGLRAAADGGHVVVAASDAFFPFPDGPARLIEAGVRCLVQPGGSKRDQETVDLCAKHGVTCLLTGVRHFLH